MTVTFGWSWTLGFSAAALGGDAGRALAQVALLGPVVGLLVALWADSSVALARDLLRRTLDVRSVPARGWATVVAVGAGPALVALGAASVLGAPVDVEAPLTTAGILGAVGLALTAGLTQEPGWRGIAQDCLAQRLGVLRSALALGALWSACLLPLYFVEGTSLHGLGVGTFSFWASLLVRLPLAVLLVWLVRSHRGAVVAAVAAHGLGTFVAEALSPNDTWMAVNLSVTAVAAVLVASQLARPTAVPQRTRRPVAASDSLSR